MPWKSILERLSARSFSQVQIADLCKCGQATISDLAKGTTLDPRYSLGQALKALDGATDEEIKSQLAALKGRQLADSEPNQAPALNRRALAATDFVAS